MSSSLLPICYWPRGNWYFYGYRQIGNGWEETLSVFLTAYILRSYYQTSCHNIGWLCKYNTAQLIKTYFNIVATDKEASTGRNNSESFH